MRLVSPSGAIPLVCAVLATLTSAASAQDDPIPEAPSGQQAAAEAPDPDLVRVYVWSDRDGTVFGRAAAFGPAPPRLRWPRPPSDEFNYTAGVCTAPCSATVALSDAPFRVVGHDVASSKPFDLFYAPNGLDVRVHAGSWGGYVLGTVLTILGTVFTATGGAELLVWAALGEPRVVNHTAGVLLPNGIAFLSVGFVLAAVGIPVFLANRTRVDISEHQIATGQRGVELTPGGLAF